jgi:dephospho-CoA kinase
MLLIGLTGNIAAGKSTVAQMLADRGATIIDADELARDAVAVGSDGHRKIVERWGDDILKADGGLDRVALRQIVFQEPTELEALNSIVHPEVSRLRDDLISEARERGDETVVCDIPLLFERGVVNDFDRIVLVDAPRPLRLERLIRDRALGQSEAMHMIAAQMPAELKRARADFIIDNDGDLAALEERVDEVWRALHSPS